jgi:hypothetical protein
VQRAKIVTFSDDRLPVLEAARGALEGVDGLLRDKTFKPALRPSPTLAS